MTARIPTQTPVFITQGIRTGESGVIIEQYCDGPPDTWSYSIRTDGGAKCKKNHRQIKPKFPPADAAMPEQSPVIAADFDPQYFTAITVLIKYLIEEEAVTPNMDQFEPQDLAKTCNAFARMVKNIRDIEQRNLLTTLAQFVAGQEPALASQVKFLADPVPVVPAE